jgi:hypothetical protein
MVYSKSWATALFCCLCLLSVQYGFSQSPPVAGITFDSLQTGFFYNSWTAFVKNTATGNPTSWEYRITPDFCTALPCQNYGGFTTASYSPTAAVTNNLYGLSGPVKIWQIVSNAFGSDTTFIVEDFDCQHLTSPMNLEIVYYTSSLPYIGAYAYSNIWVNIIEISIYGPTLTTSPKHSFGSGISDTILVPGPVWACGYYYSSNCFSQRTFCDTINIPCWRSPVVTLQQQMNGFQATFTNSVIATAGATWMWDFGDGNTSTATSNSLTHTYTSAGTYNACLTITDTCGTTTTCTTIALTSTGQSPTLSAINIVPNPSDGRFRLEGHRLLDDELQYHIQDMQSNLIAAGKLSVDGGELQQTMDLQLPKGIYLIGLEDAHGNRHFQKLVITE